MIIVFKNEGADRVVFAKLGEIENGEKKYAADGQKHSRYQKGIFADEKFKENSDCQEK